MKDEIKNSTDQLRHSLQESEGKSQMDREQFEERLMAAMKDSEDRIAAMVEASEERTIDAIMTKLRTRKESDSGDHPEKSLILHPGE